MSDAPHTDYRDEATCPYCGYVGRDSWELFGPDDEDNDAQCGSCGKEYRVSRNVSVTYTSQKMEPEQEATT